MLSDQVVHETLDGETVIIDLARGTYFSLEGSGADLWARLLTGESPAQSASALATAHDADSVAMTAAIVAFHQQLFDHGLLTVSPPAAPDGGGALGTFTIPTLRVYDDLREHLLLDPVHDVERGAGWPTVPSSP
ncbi:hypothetical protein FHT40_004584 [Mycolicibacterium sp. BK556]|uniref:PqqD family protein n=1 Tax=Mycobacteriaceae TaxID=1762 RepID=UPI0010DE8DF2|nr:PqqD family protein [Mycobacterium sp. BK086]MBB3604900.1 hypothetical protein [Mycolicibacterium sp. BK556]MBB3635096.1 hypothetical protein [Mycolicibacterium sp. BK607]MBB3748109.1 hypothetical protein [Mycolicibacterium sp. BK634]TDO07759.1 coenzyme PQQ synthesis protein D (PqqD) [Mycobacterium sp. BK086]